MRQILFILGVVLCFGVEKFTLTPCGTCYYDRGALTEMQFDRFNIYAENALKARVEKGWFGGYRYLVNGLYAGSQYSAWFSKGSFFSSMTDWTVYDGNDAILGYAKGLYQTEGAAEFELYDYDMKLIGKVKLDRGWNSIVVVDDKHTEIWFCTKYFQELYLNVKYYWKVEKKSDAIDDRFVWPLLCFLADKWW